MPHLLIYTATTHEARGARVSSSMSAAVNRMPNRRVARVVSSHECGLNKLVQPLMS